MPYSSDQDLSGKHPVNTRNILVTTDGHQLYDGTGSLITSLTITAFTSSYVTESHAIEPTISSSIISSSVIIVSNFNAITASINYLLNSLTPNRVVVVDTDGSTKTNNNLQFDGHTLQIAANPQSSSLRVGTIESQTDSLNNAWVSENVYFDGTYNYFTFRDNGAGGMLYFNQDELQFRLYAAGNTGDQLNTASQFKASSDGTVALGGIIRPSAGSTVGASMVVSPTNVVINASGNLTSSLVAGDLIGTSSYSQTSSYVTSSNIVGGLTQEIYFMSESFTKMSFVNGILVSVT